MSRFESVMILACIILSMNANQACGQSLTERDIPEEMRNAPYWFWFPYESGKGNQLANIVEHANRNHDLPDRIAKLNGKDQAGHLFVPPSGKWLGMATGNIFRIWDLQTGAESARIATPTGKTGAELAAGEHWCVATDASERTVITAKTHYMAQPDTDTPNSICIWDRETGELLHQFTIKPHREIIENLTTSPDGQLLAVRIRGATDYGGQRGGGYIQWIDVVGRKLLNRSELPPPEPGQFVGEMLFRPQGRGTPQDMAFVDDRTLMFLAKPPFRQLPESGRENRGVYIATPSPDGAETNHCRLVHEFTTTYQSLAFQVAPDRESYAIAEYDEWSESSDRFGVQIVLRSLPDHAERRMWRLPYDGHCNADLSFSEDGRQLLVSTKNPRPVKSVMLDVESGELRGCLGISRARFVPGGDFIAGFNEQDQVSTIQLWSRHSLQPVLGLVPFASERHWAIVTADGEFAATEAVLSRIQPSLVEARLRPQTIQLALKGIPLASMAQLPEGYSRPRAALHLVAVDQSQTTISMDVSCFGEGVTLQSISLDRRERALPSDVLEYVRNAPLQGQSQQLTVSVPFPPGKNSMTLEVVATDSQGIPSKVVSSTFERATHVHELSGRLFVLAVGVSEYKYPEYQLRYPADDATAIAAEFEKQEGLAFGEVHTQVYTNENATVQNVRDGLNWLKRATSRNDVAVLFFSGHGVRSRRGLYYLTHEGDTEAIQTSCLNWDEIAKTLESLESRQTIFLSDVCHAGAFAESQLAMQADLAKRMLEIDGLLVFASSQGDEVSLERDDWRHGAFTKCLLEGLFGLGDANGDREISVHELISYTQLAVKSLTARTQNPYLPKQSGFNGNLIIARSPGGGALQTEKVAKPPVAVPVPATE
ncbi:MAG: caspase family protein [Planctomycetaceae bacterium]|nr:caspase family protein [Planctomycetaceae bacterium]